MPDDHWSQDSTFTELRLEMGDPHLQYRQVVSIPKLFRWCCDLGDMGCGMVSGLT